jgi:hypothetical protein
MKKSLLALIASALALTACTTQPTQNEVNTITNICLIDSGIRPLVTALEVFATPDEISGIAAARVAIDQVCENPSSSVASNAVGILTKNVGYIQSILVKLQNRKGGQ